MTLVFFEEILLPRILILYRADHTEHIIIQRKIGTFLKAGLDVTVLDQAIGHRAEPGRDYTYLPVSHLTWRMLVTVTWPIIRRIGSWKLNDWFWQSLLWIRIASNAIWLGWQAARAGGDYYVAEDLQSAWAALLATRLRRRPVIYDAHEIESEQGYGEAVRIQRGVLRSLEQHIIPRVDRLVVPNHSRAAFYTERYGVHSEPIIIFNCSPTQPVSAGDRLREELGLPNSVRLVLYHGALIPHRALDNLVRSARYFAEDIVLVLIGKHGTYFEQVLLPLRNTEGLRDRVFFLPFIQPSELLPYIASADLGIVIYENVNLNNYLCAPTKLYEFIMMGVPVAVCNFPEMNKFLEQYPVGVAFDPHQPQSIADAINSFFAKRVDTLPEVQQALAGARRRYNWEREGHKWLDLIRSIAH